MFNRKTSTPDPHRLSPNYTANRSVTPNKNDDKWNQAQHDLMVKVGQMEKEVKARKEAEERYKDTLVKMERLQLALQEKTSLQESEAREREIAEERCETLRMTIDKLEEYLRKKSTNEYPRVGKSETESVTKSLADVISVENELKTKTKQLEKVDLARRRYRARCKQLQNKLLDKGVVMDDGWKSDEEDEIAEELDF
ncbi:calponin homology domain-containing protein DDB_G0272472-like [Ylistrum balloti]|uniref:calponin homology domain-containing protein DDB_G0272472-like n=1 Tax=Ylistrum balloti TaxID=509963 RepID=UPI002905BB4E|nr:calponin homology domain-containing protein DDB_G0272472-like [Ylistrum balloti]